MQMNLHISCTLGIALMASAPVLAAPRYAQSADPATVAEARQQSSDDVAWIRHRGTWEQQLAETLVEQQLGNGRLCYLHLDIVNPTGEARWGIVLTVEHGRDSYIYVREAQRTHVATIHIPYLLPRQMTSVVVPCSDVGRNMSDPDGVDSYSQGAAPGWAARKDPGTYWIGVDSHGSLEDALRWMNTTQLDSTLDAPIGPSTGTLTVLDAALSLDDDEVAAELIDQIAGQGIGVDKLVAALAAHPTSNLARHAGPAFARLPRDVQLALLDEVLADPRTVRENESALVPVVVDACAARSRAIVLWLAASADPGFATSRLRRTIQSACRPVPSDVDEIDHQLSTGLGAIDALDTRVFTALVARWSSAPPFFLPEYLAATSDQSRFKAMAGLVAPAALSYTVSALARAKPGKLSDLRLTWVRGALARISDPAQLEAVARSLFETDAAHPYANQDYHLLVEELRARFPAASAAVRWNVLAQHSMVLDVGKLAAAGIDLQELTVYMQTHDMDGCQRDLENAVSCLRAIRGSSVRGLGNAIGGALKPEFIRAIMNQLRTPSDEDLDRANELVALGCHLDGLVDRLCAPARQALAAGTFRPELLDGARRFVGSRACAAEIAAIADEQAADAAISERRRTLAGIAGLALPLMIGGGISLIWMRRRPLTEPAVEFESPAAPSRAARIARDIERGLSAGVDRAHRELAITAAGEPVIARATAAVTRAVALGAAASLLLRDGTTTFYVVALPVPHASPKVVQRYLGEPWPEHLRQVQQLAESAVTALVILCGPNAAAATLVVGTCDGTRCSDPELLLDARDARERDANRFRHTIPLAS